MLVVRLRTAVLAVRAGGPAPVEAGLALDQLIVTSTHTHESKDTMGMWGEAVGLTGYTRSHQKVALGASPAALSR